MSKNITCSSGPNPHTSLLKWEREILSGSPPDFDKMRQIPLTELRQSPLLMRMYGEYLIQHGRFPEAESLLLDAAKGMADQGLRRCLLSSLSLLAILYLRTGRCHDAETLVRFLYAEWMEDQQLADGYVALTLAQGIYLIDIEHSDDFYIAALEKFANDGLPDLCCYTALSLLMDSGKNPCDQLWHTAKAYIAQQSVITRIGTRYTHYALGIRYVHNQEWEAAVKSFEAAGVNSEKLLYDHFFTIKLQLLYTQARLFAGSERYEQTLTQLKPPSFNGEKEHDLYLRFAYGCLRVEEFLLEKRWKDANEQIMKLTSIVTLSRNPQQDLVVRSLISKLIVSQEAESDEATVPYSNPLVSGTMSRTTSTDVKMASIFAAPQRSVDLTSPSTTDPVQVNGHMTFDSADFGHEDEGTSASQGSWNVYSFGPLVMTRGQQEIRHIHWGRKKSYELLAYLLLRPHYSAQKELAADALFPDSTPQQLNNQLHVTIHHLRQVLRDYLGVAKGVLMHDGVIRIREELFEQCDYEKYMVLSRVGDHLWTEAQDVAVEMYDQAIQIYDELFPELQSIDWLDRIRESLLERQTAMLRKLGRYAKENLQSERYTKNSF